MAMRDRFPLDKIELPKDQERIMDVMCKAWEECDESECKGCIDRKSHFMSIRECVSIKASRMLADEGYERVVRCKDCKHYSDFDCNNCKRLTYHFCDKFWNITKENDFCSYGERREQEK